MIRTAAGLMCQRRRSRSPRNPWKKLPPLPAPVGAEDCFYAAKYRGEQHRLQGLIAKGEVRVETVAHLDHSLLERTSHDRVAELFGAYVAQHAAALSRRSDGPVPPS